MARMLGYSREEVIGKYGPDFAADRAEREASQQRMKSYENGTPQQYEVRLRRKDGSEFWALASASPLFDAKGRHLGNLGMYIDITERKQAEQLKDEFIGLVSHEIRTPLTVLIGAIGTAMSEGIAPEDLRSMLHEAMDGAESLSHIVDNLVELSRYQSDRLMLQKEPIDIGVTVRALAEKAKIHTSHTLFLDLPGDLPPVYADSMRL